MPNLNQRGPENMGPMTGRKMGRCMTEDTQNRPYGCGLGNGRRRDCGRTMGARGNRFANWSGPENFQTIQTKDDLYLRAKALEKELEAVRNELKNL